MQPTLVHIGYHKTASSFLRRNLFIAGAGFDMTPRREVVARFVECNPWDVPMPWAPVAPTGGVAVLSHERLSGHPTAGGADAPLILTRLKAALPGARVLIVVREQRSAILSNYAQYIRSGGGASLTHVMDGLPGTAALPWFDTRYFEYDHLVSAYQHEFGVEAVCVLPFEALVDNPASFLRRILDFVDVGGDPTTIPRAKINERLSGWTLGAKRLVNRWFVVNRYSPGPPIPMARAQHASRVALLRADRLLKRIPADPLARRWVRQIEEAIADRYVVSNARLSAATGLDLSSYGYASV